MQKKTAAPRATSTNKAQKPAKSASGKPELASVTVDEDGNLRVYMPAHVMEGFAPDLVNFAKQYVNRAQRQQIEQQDIGKPARVLSPFERLHQELAELMKTREKADGEAVAELDRRIELVKADLVAEEEKQALFFEEVQILQSAIKALNDDCAALAVEMVRTGNELNTQARLDEKRKLLRGVRAKYRALSAPWLGGHEVGLIHGAA